MRQYFASMTTKNDKVNLKRQSVEQIKKRVRKQKRVAKAVTTVIPVDQVIEKFTPNENTAWRLHVQGATKLEICDRMQVSMNTVTSWIARRTAHLADIHSPEEQRAATGMILARYADIYNTAVAMMNDEGEGQKAAWAAIALKATDLTAKIYGIGGEAASGDDISSAFRLAQVVERLRAVGSNTHPCVVKRLEGSAMAASDIVIQPVG